MSSASCPCSVLWTFRGASSTVLPKTRRACVNEDRLRYSRAHSTALRLPLIISLMNVHSCWVNSFDPGHDWACSALRNCTNLTNSFCTMILQTTCHHTTRVQSIGGYLVPLTSGRTPYARGVQIQQQQRMAPPTFCSGLHAVVKHHGFEL